MTWLSLVDGAPRGLGSAGREQSTPSPGPADFLQRLFAELCGAAALPRHLTDEREVPRVERVATGCCGTAETGYRWVEEECLETSAVPYRVFVETQGLPGMELRWRYSFAHAGQLGYADFCHGSLQARFADATAQRRFGEVWRAVFGTVPRWEAAAQRRPSS
jgi:hypothetical protein